MMTHATSSRILALMAAGLLTAAGTAHADTATSGNGSIGGGNQIGADVDAPVNVCGNSVALLGAAGAQCVDGKAGVGGSERTQTDRRSQHDVYAGYYDDERPDGRPGEENPDGCPGDGARTRARTPGRAPRTTAGLRRRARPRRPVTTSPRLPPRRTAGRRQVRWACRRRSGPGRPALPPPTRSLPSPEATAPGCSGWSPPPSPPPPWGPD
ncbi:chaplin family protein [Nocardiopsis sp. CNR-923]|uniref:chaplin family protein n=1 Tax=Nocardiopsis sp. CNR-923 TaxID=1904965 RepID=UPI0009FB4CAF|nr:chaplin family protein [Nocardiopsis sp. CNR-923]